MTTKEKIAVMQAYLDGKTIQYKGTDEEEWLTWDEQSTIEPCWAWKALDYRIKPEAKVRPYTFKEMCEAVKKHGILVRGKKRKNRNEVWAICSFDNKLVNTSFNYFEMMEFVWFDDDSPCGVVEE